MSKRQVWVLESSQPPRGRSLRRIWVTRFTHWSRNEMWQRMRTARMVAPPGVGHRVVKYTTEKP